MPLAVRLSDLLGVNEVGRNLGQQSLGLTERF